MIEIRNITKTFGKVTALADISLDIRHGRVTGILGENGAGKSTLMNILYGLLQPDSGSISLNGEPFTPGNPNDALARGISMVHQSQTLIDDLSVLENIILGAEPVNRFGMIDFTEAEERLRELFSWIGCTIDPGVKIARLDTLERQLIDIAKALFRDSGVIILDEPTSLLAPPQVEKLFRVLEEVKKEKTVILVTHRIAEVEMIVDDIVVLRGGELVLTKEKSKAGRKEIIKAIIGSDRGLPEKRILTMKTGGRKNKEKEAALLELDSISTVRYGNDAGLNSFSLSLMPGEIVGLTGLPGNGQTSLLSMLSGISPPESGEIIFKEQRYSRKKYKHLRNEPLGLIFPERDKQGLIISMKLVDNLLLNKRQLKQFSMRGIIDYRKLREYSARAVKKYRIKSADAEKDVSILSGGNRQKVVLARETTSDVEVIIAAEPVRGLDIKAAEDVKTLILEMKRNGKSVLIISGDLDFLFSLCDSIGVLYRGELKELNQTRRLSVEALGKAMLGYS